MKTVLFHGLGQTPQDWRAVLAQLSTDAECPALFEGLDDPTYPKILDRLERRYSGAEPLCLCGLSLGAVLALDFAARHPEQVTSLLLMAPQYKVSRPLLAVQDAVFRLLPESAFADMGLHKADLLCLTRSMRTLNLTPQLARILCPVTILCGADDKANLPAARNLAAFLPQAELHILPHTGHEINKTAPQVVAAYLI